MSAETVAVETPVAASTPKPKAKAPAKKPTAAKPAPASKGKAKPAGVYVGEHRLRKSQITTLKVLAKSNTPQSRKQISEKGKTDLAALTEAIGSEDDAVRIKNDKKHYPSLVTMALIKPSPAAEGGGTVYMITAKGRTVAAKA